MKLCGFWFRSKGNETLAVKNVTQRERERERENSRKRKWGSQREREKGEKEGRAVIYE